jgi:hypothetical protein
VSVPKPRAGMEAPVLRGKTVSETTAEPIVSIVVEQRRKYSKFQDDLHIEDHRAFCVRFTSGQVSERSATQ